MYVNFENINNTLIVNLSGELDHHSAEEVRVKIDDRIERDRSKKLIFNFKEVTFMDSSGIGVVIGRYKKLLTLKGEVAVVYVNRSVKRVFELSGMFKIIKLYDSLDEALGFVNGGVK
ncbi:anti-anti-sigma regulatory factor, SpoIIAA [Clostridium cavendishii DSM 21758]|uniref:Anti-sigma F factor antagonist n=1 Tax=Clostridium cavendishii DSM 21758 TaxID=1121302 RepID=A0A1M6AQV0_9CLOT|nr:anti-sigma F factor antagonist [Clostridium cavendishii]SHI38767.1 anti-anti-sigma regulatory factor, SpoIIAA [Clostridium cavendishii DSM 21758]